METKEKKSPAKGNKEKNGDLIQFLKEKKARDGKLNKLGEWLLNGAGPLFTWDEKDLKYILK